MASDYAGGGSSADGDTRGPEASSSDSSEGEDISSAAHELGLANARIEELSRQLLAAKSVLRAAHDRLLTSRAELRAAIDEAAATSLEIKSAKEAERRAVLERTSAERRERETQIELGQVRAEVEALTSSIAELEKLLAASDEELFGRPRWRRLLRV
jgi:chromosome segregation ATPase